MSAIQVDALVKSYNGNRAVDGISFEVGAGEIFGMLGPNGAGKTTTVEILEGLREPDSGSALVLGKDVSRDGSEAKQSIGVAPQSTALMPNLTCFETLDLFASFYRRALAPDSLLNRLGLQEKRDARVRTLSGGQAQRLSVAIALINDAQVVFLDEPTTGLDPQARRTMWDVIEAMRVDGRTVFLTTHYMEEAERLCDRVAVMDHGSILAIDTPGGLIANYFGETAIEVALPASADASAEDALFDGLAAVSRVNKDEGRVTLFSSSVNATLAALFDRAARAGTTLDDVHVRRGSLEDVFLKLTGRRIRD